MALYGGRRDISLFRRLNRELYQRIITQLCDIFKASLYSSDENLYGEILNKKYFPGVRVAGIIGTEDQTAEYEDNNVDVEQTATFTFLRDDIKKIDTVLEIGDIVHWDNKFWEIDKVVTNKYYMGRNPDTNKSITDKFGWNISIICSAHVTKRSTVKLEEVRAGKSSQNKSKKKTDNFY
jgi:hypothetical protein